jgi:hypothetical protein
MSDNDLTAPSVPKKGGLFKRLFGKDSAADLPPPPPQSAEDKIDLDEIKRKLGITDEELPAQPKPEIHVDNWSEDLPPLDAHSPEMSEWAKHDHAELVKPEEQTWATEDLVYEEPEAVDMPQEPPAHHEAVEAQLKSVDKAHEKLENTITKTIEELRVPDWNLQQQEVEPEEYFILRNGHPVRSLQELIEALEYISDATFEHHVTEHRNDFANWIRDVIGEPELAQEVQSCEDRADMLRALLAHKKAQAQDAVKEQQKLQSVLQKRKKTLEQLSAVEQQVDTLRSQLQQKTQELLEERKKSAQTIKAKLDEELQKRMTDEQNTVAAQRQELSAAKQNYLDKVREYEKLTKEIAERERLADLKEQEISARTNEIRSEQRKLDEEKAQATQLLKDAEQLRMQYGDLKKLDFQTQKNIEEVAKREMDLSRREEALRQREAKVNADLTRMQAESDRVEHIKEDHAGREEEVRKMEEEAQQLMEQAEQRLQAAVEQERNAKATIQIEKKKLEAIRTVIDRALAKALGEKHKASKAIALRKQLEEAITGAQQHVDQERQAMRDDMRNYMEEKIDTTPVGQPEPVDVGLLTQGELPIYQKVEQCRQALEHRDLGTAKQLYSELREEFMKVDAPPEEKSALYNSIRELYDDIHLAMLG